METVTGQASELKANVDKNTVETTEALIALYKREFGDSWRQVFQETVSVVLDRA
jgi:hypothetical protein